MSFRTHRRPVTQNSKDRYDELASEYWELKNTEWTDQEKRYLQALEELKGLKDGWDSMFMDGEDQVSDLLEKLPSDNEELYQKYLNLKRQQHNLRAVSYTHLTLPTTERV